MAPVERALGRVEVFPSRVGIPELHRRVDVEDAGIVAPLHDLAAVDVPGQIDEEVAGRQMFAEQRAHVLRRDLVLDERHALFDPRREDLLVGLEVHDRDTPRIDGDVPHENRQRAPCDGAETDEQDALGERLHSASAVYLRRHRRYVSFFTRTLELRPLCSYRSRRSGGKSSGVPSTKPPLD